MDLEQYQAMAGTGDLILSAARSAASWLVRRVTRSRWSHVGVVIRSGDQLQVLEALPRGVVLQSIEASLEGRETAAGIRLLHPPGRLAGELAQEATQAFLDWVVGVPYEDSRVELFLSVYDWIGGDQGQDLTTLFCSELVAEYLQRVGVIASTLSSNEWTPADFSSPNLGTYLVPPCKYSPIAQIGV